MTDDEPLIAVAIVRALALLGFRAESGAELAGHHDGVISTAGLADGASPVDVHRRALAAARALGKRGKLDGAIFVALQDTGGHFGHVADDRPGLGPTIDRAWRGGLTGLVKTASHEWPGARVKAIDVARDGLDVGQVAQRVVDELVRGDRALEVGLPADGTRCVPVIAVEPFAPAHASTPGYDLPDGAVIVASGGGRGVTAASLLGLATYRRIRVVLLGRTKLEDWPQGATPDGDTVAIRRHLAATQKGVGPRDLAQRADRIVASREIRATLDRLAALGCEGWYIALDVTDSTALGEAMAQVRAKWGQIDGLVHGAGVLADKLIKDKTDEQLTRVFSAKVDGLGALLDALKEDRLSLVALFSSIAGRYGNPGQSDYAMANEVLNRVSTVLARCWPQARVVAINWGPWDGGMADAAVRDQFAARGIRSIPLNVGGDAFAAEVLVANGRSEVIFGGPAVGAMLAQSDAAVSMPSIAPTAT